MSHAARSTSIRHAGLRTTDTTAKILELDSRHQLYRLQRCTPECPSNVNLATLKGENSSRALDGAAMACRCVNVLSKSTLLGETRLFSRGLTNRFSFSRGIAHRPGENIGFPDDARSQLCQ